MRLPTLSSLMVSLLALALATPLLSCAAEVIDEVPAPVASQVETTESVREDTTRTAGTIGTGYGDSPLAYLGGTALVPPTVNPGEDERIDPFHFRLEGERAEGTSLPDFSALSKRGYDFGFRSDELYRSSVYATSSRGDVYYFESFGHGGKRSYGLAHAAPGKDAEVFELSVKAYAFFPSHVLVRDDDVIVGASLVKEGTFGDDFPGCPISIFHGQNGVFLASIGPRGVTPIVFPGEGRLDEISTDASGALVVQTGWPEETDATSYEPNVRETWRRSASGAWTRTARKVIPAAITN